MSYQRGSYVRPEHLRPPATIGMRELVQIVKAERVHLELVTEPRPATRAGCAEVQRPCPYAGCRHHLLLDVTQWGSLRFRDADTTDPLDLDPAWSCSLDVAEREQGMSLDQIAHVFGITRERARQLEANALGKLRAAMSEELDEP